MFAGFVITPTLPDLAAMVQSRAQNNANGQTYAVFNMVYALGTVGGPLTSGYLYQVSFLLLLIEMVVIHGQALGFSKEFMILGSVLVAYHFLVFILSFLSFLILLRYVPVIIYMRNKK